MALIIHPKELMSLGIHYIYLHGFASSPDSFKARAIAQHVQLCNCSIDIPDLNQGDFSHLTLTRQIQQIGQVLNNVEYPVYLIGSSFGGLTAAWVAQHYSQVQRLVLLAPAFEFKSYWRSQLNIAEREQWKQDGYRDIYHYGEQKLLPLHYDFITDLFRYSSKDLNRCVPTLIFHGKQDNVISIQGSYSYVRSRPWVELVELQSDHGLTDKLPEICQGIQSFLKLS